MTHSLLVIPPHGEMAMESSVRRRKTWDDLMPIPDLDALQHEKVLYLTTVGRNTGKPRTIEIWFVSYQGRIYLLAEHGLKAHWVRNIQANSDVIIQIRQYRFQACGRVLDDARDRLEWQAVAELSRRKYDWGDGWPVAINARRDRGLEHS